MTSMRPKIGLALAGGGIVGGIYEVGALRALEDAVIGLSLHEAEVLVGVSAGGFLAACLANGMTTRQLVRSVLKSDQNGPAFRPELFYTPALEVYWRKGMQIPSLMKDALHDYLTRPEEETVFKAISRLTRAIPCGLFSNRPIERFFRALFSQAGMSNDFRALGRKLFIIAADLNNGEERIFSHEDPQEVSISKAIQASTALPGVYPPVEIAGRYFVDGILLKTMHASLAVDKGADLVLCVNPIVPVDTSKSVEMGFMKRGNLIDRGLFGILSQTLRTMIHSRMVLGFHRYEGQFEDKDLLLFEPSRDDYRMFFTNIFSFNARKYICEHAYLQTLSHIRIHRESIATTLKKHGLTLREHVLGDPERDIWRSVGLHPRHDRQTWVTQLDESLDVLADTLERTGVPT
jgi:predicted acylesterase/phospholipase RssA